MNIIILCGGKGTRLEGFDLPKPLCTIKGKSILYHVIDAIPKENDKITIIYNEHLDKVQFKKTIIHSCCELKDIDFIKINIDTRGPVETAYIGLQKSNFKDDEPIIFMDNDTINQFNLSDIKKENLGIGVYKTDDSTKPYSFVKVLDDGSLVDIKEKEGISNTYCTGVYYFPSIKIFKNLCENLFISAPKKKEYFISDLYATALTNNNIVSTFMCTESIALGTRVDIINNIDRIKYSPMRICFDIDNTLLTYSNAIGSHEGIEPISEMVDLVKKLHNEGHTIVLHTARGMKTCKSNIGQAGKRGMLNVLQTLEEFEIPYDEIYFGKPWADLYVDDKAWNQYTNASFSQFFFNQNVGKSKMYLPKSCSNNENTLYKKNQILIKEGPISSLEGESYFYKKINNTNISILFPHYFTSNITLNNYNIEMEFIEGVTVSKLFRNKLLRKQNLKNIFDGFKLMHSTNIENDNNISKEDILVNYIGKLEERIKTHPNYKLPNIDEVLNIIKNIIIPYVNSDDFVITNIIHGDPWFDNMVLTLNQEVKFLDMKGKIGSILSLKGDKIVDYAKIYQSILGFDYFLNGETYDIEYEDQCRRWLTELLPFPIDDPIFEAITACCILKTFYYFSKTEPILPIYNSLSKMKICSILKK
jgi:capsule biosynthesis phosphatase